jgi:solute carrier family 12 sodium/potassium/chloride transporter 2
LVLVFVRGDWLIGCLAVMFLINAIATIIAALIVLGIYILQQRALIVTLGDVRYGLWMGLLLLTDAP